MIFIHGIKGGVKAAMSEDSDVPNVPIATAAEGDTYVPVSSVQPV
jgi:hypothetical protein